MRLVRAAPLIARHCAVAAVAKSSLVTPLSGLRGLASSGVARFAAGTAARPSFEVHDEFLRIFAGSDHHGA